MMVLLAKPVDNALFVDPQKTDEFLKEKCDPLLRQKRLERAKKIKKQMEQNLKKYGRVK